jgi:hypothetical protein
MSEYDRSTPPVQPPIPFDLPLIPDITSIKRKKMDAKKEAKEQEKKRKDSEINEILVGSYHHQSMKATPFLEQFMRFERRSAHGKNVNEMADLRCGQWLFMYAVLQSLPMLAMDAPNLQHSEGVEYFLCVPPRGSGPWVREDKAQRSWFGVANGTGVVNLPSDTIHTSVEGIYRSSHCWQAALKWADQEVIFPPTENSSNRTSSLASHPGPPQSSVGSSSDPHPSLMGPGGNPSMISLPTRGHSPSASAAVARHSNRQSIHLGLEALPLPAGVTPVEQSPRPVSQVKADSTFDKILGDMGSGDKDKKKKK